MTPIRLSDSELDAVFAAARPPWTAVTRSCKRLPPPWRAIAARSGVVFQICREQQQRHFDPPADGRAAWDIATERVGYVSKLEAGEPISDGRDRRFTRHFRLTR